MRLDSSHTYDVKDKSIKLVAESFEEPTPGNVFWSYSFYVDGRVIENRVLESKNDGLFPNLDSFIFSSEDNNYVYIPKYRPVIYNVDKKDFFGFDAPLKNCRKDFVKNYFYNDFLVIIYRCGIVKVDLNSWAVSSLEFSSADVFIEEGRQTNEDEVELEYRDLRELVFKKKIVKL